MCFCIRTVGKCPKSARDFNWTIEEYKSVLKIDDFSYFRSIKKKLNTTYLNRYCKDYYCSKSTALKSRLQYTKREEKRFSFPPASLLLFKLCWCNILLRLVENNKFSVWLVKELRKVMFEHLLSKIISSPSSLLSRNSALHNGWQQFHQDIFIHTILKSNGDSRPISAQPTILNAL